MGELSKLPNIGKTVEEQLLQVGIRSAGELKQIGAKSAWLKIQEIDESDEGSLCNHNGFFIIDHKRWTGSQNFKNE